jgi:hypothetical protein
MSSDSQLAATWLCFSTNKCSERFDFCRAMVVGTFKLGLKATSGDGVWYHDSGELTDDMSASDALGDYNKSFK